MSNSWKLRTLAALALALLFHSRPAAAGCGCDHPPAPWALVTPPFASPGKQISVFADSGEFKTGKLYKVDFGGSAVVEVVARESGRLRVTVPAKTGTDPGPKALKVQGPGYDREYARELFTALPPAPVVPAQGGSFAIRKFVTAVADDGTLLIPLDVGQVLDATQFAFVMNSLLVFGANDVGIFNADGVDLTLFTLSVDAVQRQWGEYYGWRVEDDTGLHGDVYDPGVQQSVDATRLSDLLSYWRHEFYTYAAAHGTGGTHQVDADGLHPDGTVHIDHDHLVIAIRPRLRKSWDSDDFKTLSGGKFETDLAMIAYDAAGPLSSTWIHQEIRTAVSRSQAVWNSGPERTLVPIGPY